MAKLKIKGSADDIDKILNGKKDGEANGPAEFTGKPPMDENPQSRQAEGMHESETADTTKTVKPTTTRPGTPEGTVEQGYDVVQQVARKFDADGPEAARKKNNMARDARTNLGRGTWSTPTLS
jgi:hypothetical protein